jgi:Fe-S cluster assembly protein SufD
VLSLREALARGEAEILAALAGDAEDPTLALNAALMQDGAVLRVSPGCVLERPLEFANFISGGAARSVFTRSLVILGAGARATLLESFTPLERSGAQENHALVMVLGDGAKLDHVATIAPQSEDAVRVVSLLATLGENSALNSFCLVEGGGLLRRQIFATLSGANADVSFNGASLLRGRDHRRVLLEQIKLKIGLAHALIVGIGQMRSQLPVEFLPHGGHGVAILWVAERIRRGHEAGVENAPGPDAVKVGL